MSLSSFRRNFKSFRLKISDAKIFVMSSNIRFFGIDITEHNHNNMNRASSCDFAFASIVPLVTEVRVWAVVRAGDVQMVRAGDVQT